MIKVSIKGVEATLKSIDDISKAMSSTARRNIGNEMAYRALELVKDFTPGKGVIREQWQVTPKRNYEWIISNTAAETEKGKTIIQALEYGTKPHTIMPRYKKALHFFIGEEEVFATKVMHPGTKAYMMLRRTTIILNRSMEYIGNRFLNQLSKLWK